MGFNMTNTDPQNPEFKDIFLFHGKSAYQAAVQYGYTGTEEEWIQSLKDLRFGTFATFPIPGDTNLIYIDSVEDKIYRWDGTSSTYIPIGGNLELGETLDTAYRGDRGKTAYDHSQSAHSPANAQKNSDILKSEIETKLTGNITSHEHTKYSLATHLHDDRYFTETEVTNLLATKAALVHGHTASEITGLPTTLPPSVFQLTTEDMNNVLECKFYYGGGSNSVLNKPAGVDAFALLVMRSAGGWYTQLLFSSNNGQSWKYRSYNGTTWTGWANINDAGNAAKVNGHTVDIDVPAGAKFTDTIYEHPTNSGYKHIPTGGASGQVLRWSADGTAVWDDEEVYALVTTLANGLMSAADKMKLDGIAVNANNYTLPVAGASLGGIKSGTDITIDASGNVSVNDDSHNHIIANIDGLIEALAAKLDASANAVSATKLATARNINGVAFDGTQDIDIIDPAAVKLYGTVVAERVATWQSSNKLKCTNFTIASSVPAGAKFTDTVYEHPDTHPAAMITEDSTKRFVSDADITNWNAKATTEFVTAQINALIDAAPDAINTLKELATALGNDPNFATTMTNSLATKVDKIAGKGLSTNDFTTELMTKLQNFDGTTQVASANTCGTVAKVTFSRYNSGTLLTPYAQSISTASGGLLITYLDTAAYGIQIALSSGKKEMFIRSLDNGTWSAWVDSRDGGKAAQLMTARTINGVAFDGTQNINITVDQVNQINSATASFRPLVMGSTAVSAADGTDLDASVTNTLYVNKDLYTQPSTGLLGAKSVKLDRKANISYNANLECIEFTFG